METRAVFKTRRVDSMGNGNSCGGDDLTGDYCVCFASEREGWPYILLMVFYSKILLC